MEHTIPARNQKPHAASLLTIHFRVQENGPRRHQDKATTRRATAQTGHDGLRRAVKGSTNALVPSW